MPNLLELEGILQEATVREIIEKTKAAGIVWSHLGGTQFSATKTEGSTVWDFYITKTQIGNLSYKYTLDIKKDSVAYITVQDGPIANTDRESMVKELYEITEIIVLELDKKLRETIQMVQNIEDCRDT
jgi:hypothetical protein